MRESGKMIALCSAFCRGLAVAGCLGAIVLLCSCSGGITRQSTGEAATANAKIAKPSHIYIGEVDATSGKWTTVSDTPEYHEKAKTWLKKSLLEKITPIAPTSEYTGSETTGLLIKASTLEVDVNDIHGRAMWGAQTYPPTLIARIQVYDLAQSTTTPATVFSVKGNYWAYKPLLLGAGGKVTNDYIDICSISIGGLTCEELERLCR